MASTTLIDLPPPAIKGSDEGDKLVAWEYQTPFARCSMMAFMAHLDLAHQASGAGGRVQLSDLAKEFSTPVWRDLKKEDS